jgi:pantetheine-phosphate adenylyltransferase
LEAAAATCSVDTRKLSSAATGKRVRGERLRYNRSSLSQHMTSRTVTALYPGSFDPITNGHLDLIERIEMLREVVRPYPTVEVDSFDGLLVHYAQQKGASVILRGIRAISDYEYELQMALMNHRLCPAIETVFLMAKEEFSFISSRLVKQVIGLGGNISGLVPPSVEVRLRHRVLQGI